jgi:hypothetical protein
MSYLDTPDNSWIDALVDGLPQRAGEDKTFDPVTGETVWEEIGGIPPRTTVFGLSVRFGDMVRDREGKIWREGDNIDDGLTENEVTAIFDRLTEHLTDDQKQIMMGGLQLT